MSLVFLREQGLAIAGDSGREAALGAAGALRMPLYHQIYLVLRQQISDGAVKAGDRLPSEQALTELYGVSRITAKRALDELARDGLVERGRGRGTRVRHRPAPSGPAGVGQLDDVLALGLETEVRLLAFDTVPASAEIAAALAIEPGQEVQRAVRVRSAGGQPFSYLVSHVPGRIGRAYGPEDLGRRPLLLLLEEAGVHAARARQTISATLADAPMAAALETAVGAALLRVRRVVEDRDGRAVEHLVACYRPDRYQYPMVLERRGADDPWSPAASVLAED